LLDFNKDGIDDIFLCGNNRKNFTLHQGKKDSTFAKAVKTFFLFPIDEIVFFTKSKKGEDYYIFISRNKRLVGLVSFTKKNTLQLLHKIKLDSYPSVMKIVDLNKDNKPEALIYGNNFNGLALVENKGFRLSLTKIVKDKIFTDALIYDFNQDGYEEIILVDMLNNSLNFYESTPNRQLQNVREIVLDEIITKAKILNYNDDDFFDIAIAKESGIEILQGDSVYSFSKTENLDYNFTINSFLFSDLDSDGSNDFLLFNKTDDKIIFEYDRINDENNLVFYFPGLTDFNLQNNGNNKKLIALSKKGKLNIVSNLSQWGSSFDFYVGQKPTIIKTIKKKDKNNFGFAIYDEQDKSVNIILIDSVGNFNSAIKIPFTNPVSNFVISNDLSTIIGYSEGDKLLEKISLSDFGKKRMKYFMYANYPISDIKINNSANIFVAELDSGKLYSQVFLQKGNSYLPEKPIFIDSSVVSTTLGEKFGEYFYWNKNKNKYSFFAKKNDKSKIILNIKNTDSNGFQSFFINGETQNQQRAIVYVKNNSKEFVYFPKLKSKQKIEICKKNKTSRSTTEDYFFLKGKQNKLFYRNKIGNQIIELQHNKKKNKFEQTKIIKTNKIKNFIVEKIFGKTYLIYSNIDNGNITFQIILGKQKR